MEDKKLAVVALGGNAILRGNQRGTMEEQNQNNPGDTRKFDLSCPGWL